MIESFELLLVADEGDCRLARASTLGAYVTGAALIARRHSVRYAALTGHRHSVRYGSGSYRTND